MFANLLIMLAWPTISSNQSSIVALLDHHISGPRWLRSRERGKETIIGYLYLYCY